MSVGNWKLTKMVVSTNYLILVLFVVLCFRLASADTPDLIYKSSFKAWDCTVPQSTKTINLKEVGKPLTNTNIYDFMSLSFF